MLKVNDRKVKAGEELELLTRERVIVVADSHDNPRLQLLVRYKDLPHYKFYVPRHAVRDLQEL